MARKGRSRRDGQVAVELAMIAPIIFFFVFTAIEFGRVLMAVHCLESAAQESCRKAILDGATEAQVETVCEDWLRQGGISEFSFELSPTSLSTMEQWAPVTVSLRANYGDISWLPLPDYIGNIQLSASCTLPREPEPDSSSQ